MPSAPLPIDDAPFIRDPELIRLTLVLERLRASENDQDAILVAQSLDYVADLITELERVRPRRKRRAAAALVSA